MIDVPDFVYVLWIIALVVVLLVVPFVVYWLNRLLRAAQQTERYITETLTAGLGVAGNTGQIVALESTIQVATAMLNTTHAIDDHAAAIENLLGIRAGVKSNAKSVEVHPWAKH